MNRSDRILRWHELRSRVSLSRSDHLALGARWKIYIDRTTYR
jgi:hypothetical protein